MSAEKKKLIPEIQEYIDIVRGGKYRECKDQYALCDYIEKCFNEESIYVDTKQLAQYLNFQKFFPFKLFPWEKFLFALHNCTYTAPGILRWPYLFILVGRGAGKNGFEAFESFCWITPVNGIENYHVDIFAMSEDQAKTSPDDIRAVLEDNRETLAKYFDWNLECITNKKTGSKIRFRTSGIKTKDGGRPGAIIFDEKHAYENYKIIGTSKSGLGKKAMPRQTDITTDGYVRGGPLDDDKERSMDILYRGVPDNGMLPFICRLDDKHEVSNPEMWHKANPSLAYFPDLMAQMLKEYEDYKINPSANQDFMTKRMNLPRTFEEQDVTDWENILAANAEIPELKGCDCVGAIDYAKTTDMVSAGCLFLYKGEYLWITHSWICRNSPDIPRIKAPLAEWETEGLLTFVDGPEIAPSIPSEWLFEKSKIYNMTCIGIDSFRYTLLAKALKDVGFDTDKDGANNIKLTKRVTIMRYSPVIISAFARKAVKWGKNQLMNWFVNNTYIVSDKDGNIIFQKKEAKSRKTDGFMAFVSAVCAAGDLVDSADDKQEEEFFFANFKVY